MTDDNERLAWLRGPVRYFLWDVVRQELVEIFPKAAVRR